MRVLFIAGALFFAVATIARGQDRSTGLAIDITRSSIEDLLDIEITSVSKKSEPITQAPAAISVLTHEDIRRAGVTSIPEALRLVPGVQVARIDANKWAVSIRGSNSRTANKLLVLIDGRSVYDLLFTGVLWETKDVMLEDVERIEVVRGPGGALWGANAVNGVINIITKSAAQTQGNLLAAGVGTEERGFASFRHGMSLGEAQHMRVYAKTLERDAGYLKDGADDNSRYAGLGFRYDNKLGANDQLTFQGDVYRGAQGTPNENLLAANHTQGGNLMAHWNRAFANGGEISLQTYFDRSELDTPSLDEIRDTFHIELKQQLAAIGIHRFIWGATYQQTRDAIDGIPSFDVSPAKRRDETVGVYLQNDIELTADVLYLTLGAKFENNDYTGDESQPNARLAWRIDNDSILWAAISRAVRIPSRLEADLRAPLPGGGEFTGNRDMAAEELTAYELGYRFRPMSSVYIDLASFLNRYENLLTTEAVTFGNKASGEVYGLEAVSTYIPTDSWKLSLGYSYLHLSFDLDEDSLDNPDQHTAREENDPEHQAFLGLNTYWRKRYHIDTYLRYVDRISSQDVPSYLVADVHFATDLNRDLQWSIVAQNLFDAHYEQKNNAATKVEAGIYTKLVYRF